MSDSKDENVMGEGRWEKIADGSIQSVRDNNGFINPNLHRRKSTDTEDRSITVGVYSLNSYRTTEYIVHDEESTTSEIP